MTPTQPLLAWLTPATVLWLLYVAMGLSVLELLWRFSTCSRRGQWRAAWGHVWHLSAGLCLMAALEVALTSRDALWIVLWLSASGGAHLADGWWARRTTPA